MHLIPPTRYLFVIHGKFPVADGRIVFSLASTKGFWTCSTLLMLSGVHVCQLCLVAAPSDTNGGVIGNISGTRPLFSHQEIVY
jgi:hypothetical protein